MASELSVEINAKKIQTLTKVAKLLRGQLQEQNKKIDNIQVEIIKIKELLERISRPGVSQVTHTKESISPVTTLYTQEDSFQKEITLPEIEKSQEKLPIISLPERSQNDKEQLIQALKVIDEL
ncbi:MAG: hypothetical protein ACW991_09170 [Candidatus Hodarchaeales archaeon]|jgi:hypothetical protein